ncbi:MAG: hypothetical protein LBM95_06670 [Lactobacillales bacterium]|jgi:hypothetical protein|nr:hypothetical protein [Lactobacillales bacterium]
MKTLNELETKLASLVDDNKQALKECKEKIVTAEKAINQADSELVVAETNVDVEQYKKTKDDIWSAKHAKELYQKQKEKLETVPLISKAEYNQALVEITKVGDTIQEELNARACELLLELKKISEESWEAWVKTNELMRTLQYGVYKDADKMILKNGNTFTQAKEYKNNETVNSFYRNRIAGSFLAKRNGEEVKTIYKSWV